jgi:hypothetical protein
LYVKGYILTTDQDFDNAILYRLIVSINDNGKHCGNHCIKTHNKEAVHLVNGHCFNKNCDFMVVAYASFYEPLRPNSLASQ